MSLQVWLPLNGSFENYGLLGSLTQTVAPTYVNGKLGKAVSTGGYKMTANQTASVLNNKAVSICFWVYINAATGTTANINMFFGNDSMGANNNRKFSLFNYPSVNDLHLSWQNDTANNTFVVEILSGCIPSYQWTHVAITYENPNGSIYINGIKKTSFKGISNSSSFAYETTVLYNSSYMYRNDFRIYDHCLSAREVKEISKGLCLHYKLGGVDGYFGGRNLVPNSYRLNGQWSAAGNYAGTTTVVADSDARCGYHIESKCTIAGSGPHYPIFTKSSDKIGKTYTWSFEAKCSTSKTGTVGHECNGAKTITLTTTWTKYTHTWTFTDSQYHSFVFYPGFAVGDILYIRDFKIEEGTKATSWTPAPSDNPALYNTNTEFDVSGFGNNASITGSVGSDGTSPRYDVSYIFNNTSTYVNRTITTAGFSNSYTISYWAKKSNIDNCMAFGFADGNRLNLYPNSGTICWNTGDSAQNPFQSGGTNIALSKYNNNQWHHYAITGNGSVTKLYIDGVAVGNAKTYKAISGSQLFISGWSTAADYKWTGGSISDFRIYATALSAADVKELYNTPISLTNTGVLMTQGEFKEV